MSRNRYVCTMTDSYFRGGIVEIFEKNKETDLIESYQTNFIVSIWDWYQSEV